MNDYFRRFDDELPSTQADLQVTESYRGVRVGLYFMIIGYLLCIPALAILIFCSQRLDENDINLALLLTGLAAIVTCFSLIMIGGFFLRNSPQEDERRLANKFLIAMGISIGCTILKWSLGLQILDVVKNIAQAYGTYFLINFFQALAINRKNEALTQTSNLLNTCYAIGIFAILGLMFFGKFLGNAAIIAVIALVLFLALFYFLWIRTLWLAIKATRFISEDAVRDYLD